MAMFIVHVKEVRTVPIEVEAESIEKARALAATELESTEIPAEYQLTMDRDECHVERKTDE